MDNKLMTNNKVGPADQLPTEIPGVSAPCRNNKQTKKAKNKWFSVLCCVGEEETLNLDLNMPPCGRGGGATSTPHANSALLNEEQWFEVKNQLASNMTKEDFIEVVDKISDWVKVAVREVVVPALEASLDLRSSGRITISSSSRKVERGETRDSPSQLNFIQGRVEKSSSCSAALPLMSTSPCSSGTPLQEPLRTLFGITGNRIFSRIHREVTRSMRNILPPEIKDYLRTNATFSLTSTILHDSLQQMNSSLWEMYYNADLYQGFFPSGSYTEDVAQNLLLTALTKIQDFVKLCTLSEWLSSTQGSPINIHKELEEMLPSVTTMTVGAIVENMLSISSEGTSSDFNQNGSDKPLWHFLQAVSDNIKSATPPQSTYGACSSLLAKEQPSNGKETNFATKESHPVAVSPHKSARCPPVTNNMRRTMSDPMKLFKFEPHYVRSSNECLIDLCTAYGEIDCLETLKVWSLEEKVEVHWQNGENKEAITIQDLLTNLMFSIANKYTEITSSLIYQSLRKHEYMMAKPRCERVLETIIFNGVNEDYEWDTDTDEINAQRLLRMSCETFHLEAFKRVSNIIMSETSKISKVTDALKTQDSSLRNTEMSTSRVSEAMAKSNAFVSAASVVSGLTSALKQTMEEELDLRLADPSADPALYTSQVQLVSENVLRSTQDNLKEGFVTNLLLRTDAAMSTQHSANLSYKVLRSSKNIAKSIIESIVSLLPGSEVYSSRGFITKEFLQSLNENLDILYMRQLLTPSAIHLDAFSDLIAVDVFEKMVQKVINSRSLDQNEESDSPSIALDRILSKDSLKQSQELIPVVRNLMLERIAALDSVKAQTSCGVAQSVISAPDLSKETVKSVVVSSFVNTATEKLLQQCLGLLSCCSKPKTSVSLTEHQCSGSTSVESESEVQQSVEQCSSEISTAIAHTVMHELAGISTYPSKQECATSARISPAQKVDAGLDKTSGWRFRLKCLKFRFKKRKNKVGVSTEDQKPDEHIPNVFHCASPTPVGEPSTSTSNIPKSKRKSLFSRLTMAFSKLCGK